MLIAEDLLLLLYDDESGKPVVGSTELDYGLAGAVLLELAMLGKVDVTGPADGGKTDRLVIRDPSPTGAVILDERLALIGHKLQGRKPKDAVGKLAKGVRDQLLWQLGQRGILREDKNKVLGVFPVTRWPAADARHEGEVRQALDAVLRIGTQPDQRTAALIAMLHATKSVTKVIASPDKRELKRRAKLIAESAWAAEAVRKAVEAVQAGAAAAAASAAAAGASASSS